MLSTLNSSVPNLLELANSENQATETRNQNAEFIVKSLTDMGLHGYPDYSGPYRDDIGKHDCCRFAIQNADYPQHALQVINNAEFKVETIKLAERIANQTPENYSPTRDLSVIAEIAELVRTNDCLINIRDHFLKFLGDAFDPSQHLPIIKKFIEDTIKISKDGVFNISREYHDLYEQKFSELKSAAKRGNLLQQLFRITTPYQMALNNSEYTNNPCYEQACQDLDRMNKQISRQAVYSLSSDYQYFNLIAAGYRAIPAPGVVDNSLQSYVYKNLSLLTRNPNCSSPNAVQGYSELPSLLARAYKTFAVTEYPISYSGQEYTDTAVGTILSNSKTLESAIANLSYLVNGAELLAKSLVNEHKQALKISQLCSQLDIQVDTDTIGALNDKIAMKLLPCANILALQILNGHVDNNPQKLNLAVEQLLSIKELHEVDVRALMILVESLTLSFEPSNYGQISEIAKTLKDIQVQATQLQGSKYSSEWLPPVMKELVSFSPYNPEILDIGTYLQKLKNTLGHLSAVKSHYYLVDSIHAIKSAFGTEDLDLLKFAPEIMKPEYDSPRQGDDSISAQMKSKLSNCLAWFANHKLGATRLASILENFNLLQEVSDIIYNRFKRDWNTGAYTEEQVKLMRQTKLDIEALITNIKDSAPQATDSEVIKAVGALLKNKTIEEAIAWVQKAK